MAHGWHLTRRFFGSLVPVGPSAAQVAWAEERLLPDEADLWRSMSRADRRHSVAVARRVDDAIGPDAGRPVVAAALLHDSGKVVCGLGTYRRVAASVVVEVAGRERVMDWTRCRGWRRRVGQYADHAAIGARLLEDAGSEPLTVAWTREHHLPEDRWSVPLAVGDALKAADDD